MIDDFADFINTCLQPGCERQPAAQAVSTAFDRRMETVETVPGFFSLGPPG
jgi:hypothetical protein